MTSVSRRQGQWLQKGVDVEAWIVSLGAMYVSKIFYPHLFSSLVRFFYIMTEVSTYCSGLHLAKFGHPKQREIFLLKYLQKIPGLYSPWHKLGNVVRLDQSLQTGGPLLCSVPTLLPGKRLTSPNNRN